MVKDGIKKDSAMDVERQMREEDFTRMMTPFFRQPDQGRINENGEWIPAAIRPEKEHG